MAAFAIALGRCLARFSLVLLLVIASSVASAQALFTFTSAPPPDGDGIDYPRSLNPARLLQGGGVAPGQFDTGAGVIFQSTHGNPGYFDANNLLTRPSSFITNEAFWADPKIGNFAAMGGPDEIASMGFQFSPRNGDDFGFDLAIASVSDPPPQSIPLFIQNTAGAAVTLQLDLAAGGAGDIAPVASGTFNTLNSPFLGVEARYRIAHQQLEAFLGSSDPLVIAALELASVSTTGGTTQVAVDNFVTAGAGLLPNEMEREPVRFRSALLNPGELVFFILDPASSQEVGVVVDVGTLPLATVIELAARAATPPGSALPETEAVLTIPSTSAVRDEPDVRLSAPSDTPPTNLPSSVQGLGSIEVQIDPMAPPGAQYYIQAATQLQELQQIQSLEVQALSEAQKRIVEIDLLTRDTPTVTYLMTSETNRSAGALLPSDSPPQNQSQLQTEGASTQTVLASVAAAAETEIGPFDLYINFSLQEYLAERAALASSPQVGDTGSTYTVITDADGVAVDFLLETWAIADSPGVFAPALLVPEPGATASSVVSLAMVAVLVSRRRQRAGIRER